MLPALSPSVETERRGKKRYPVQLAAFYRLLGNTPRSGAGQTLNGSSSGILLACEGPLQVGGRIEVTLHWPSMLDSLVPLQLVTRGRIVRIRGAMCGVQFSSYQFRTAKRSRLEAPR